MRSGRARQLRRPFRSRDVAAEFCPAQPRVVEDVRLLAQIPRVCRADHEAYGSVRRLEGLNSAGIEVGRGCVGA
jgi:hypothetical protein